MAGSEPQPGEAYWQAILPIWEAISIYDGPDVFLGQFRSVRPELGHLFAAHWCQSEVCNGGFHQFFHNSTGVLAPEAAEGFRAIGMPQAAALVQEAMSFFGSEYPRDQEMRIAALDAYAEQHPGADGEYPPAWDLFHELDGRFFDELDHSGTRRFDRAADEYARRIEG
jgi:hypothetical protein